METSGRGGAKGLLTLQESRCVGGGRKVMLDKWLGQETSGSAAHVSSLGKNTPGGPGSSWWLHSLSLRLLNSRAAAPWPPPCTPEPIRGQGGKWPAAQTPWVGFWPSSEGELHGAHSICHPALAHPPQGRPEWEEEKSLIEMPPCPHTLLGDPPALGSCKGPSPIGCLDVWGEGWGPSSTFAPSWGFLPW